VTFSSTLRIASGLILGLLLPALAAAQPLDPTTLAVRIDQHLANAWQRAGIQPATVADDATFLRRIYLDLVGRIPTAAETQAFLDDSRPDRRTLLIEQLIESGGYARNFLRPSGVASGFRRLIRGSSPG